MLTMLATATSDDEALALVTRQGWDVKTVERTALPELVCYGCLLGAG
jgi:hypothetical protein